MATENRGGKREGAGRKPETLSGRQVKEMLKTAKEWAKEQGKTIDDILMYIIYDKKTNDNSRLAAIKLFKEYTIAKIQEGGEMDKVLGPTIYLPEQKPTLAAVTDIKEAKKDSVDTA